MPLGVAKKNCAALLQGGVPVGDELQIDPAAQAGNMSETAVPASLREVDRANRLTSGWRDSRRKSSTPVYPVPRQHDSASLTFIARLATKD